MRRETRARSRRGERRRAQAPARLAAAAAILAGILVLLACERNEPASDAGSTGTAPAPDASAPSPDGSATTSEGTVRIDPHPAPLRAAPAPPATPGATTVPSEPAPGTVSVRFIVRKRETGDELGAGSFEVRLLPLDPIREGAGGEGSTDPGAPGAPPAGVTAQIRPPGPGIAIGQAPSSPGSGATYKGAPEQVLVTQLDGTKRTYLAGVRPGTYAMRITAKGRRMLLEVLTVEPDDRLVERALEAE